MQKYMSSPSQLRAGPVTALAITLFSTSRVCKSEALTYTPTMQTRDISPRSPLTGTCIDTLLSHKGAELLSGHILDPGCGFYQSPIQVPWEFTLLGTNSIKLQLESAKESGQITLSIH